MLERANQFGEMILHKRSFVYDNLVLLVGTSLRDTYHIYRLFYFLDHRLYHLIQTLSNYLQKVYTLTLIWLPRVAERKLWLLSLLHLLTLDRQNHLSFLCHLVREFVGERLHYIERYPFVRPRWWKVKD